MDFSRRLKELRESQDITQEQLAALLNVSRPTIAGYETKQRQPDYDKLIMLSDIFHVSTDFLLTGRENTGAFLLEAAPEEEQRFDRKVLHAYKKLDFRDKQAVYEYIRLLELRENSR